MTFDAAAAARQAESEPEAFLDALPEPLRLDDVQYVPALFHPLKLRIDQDRRPGRFLMTGSQTFSSMKTSRRALPDDARSSR